MALFEELLPNNIKWVDGYSPVPSDFGWDTKSDGVTLMAPGKRFRRGRLGTRLSRYKRLRLTPVSLAPNARAKRPRVDGPTWSDLYNRWRRRYWNIAYVYRQRLFNSRYRPYFRYRRYRRKRRRRLYKR